MSGLTILDRGYTGHEHLQSVGLINMNARLYDPILHRFLQVDNYIQDITNTQNYNQYGYVFNNPLLYIDPSGNASQGGGGDCKGCGIGVGPGDQTGTSFDIDQFVRDYGIDKWWRKNINGDKISKWWKSKISFNNIFGRHKQHGPPPNLSKYVSINVTALTGAPVGEVNNSNIFDWYSPGGKVNWGFATASGIGTIKGALNSEQMYADGIRRGVKANYELTGRNLSMFRDAPPTKASFPISKVGQWAKTVGEGSFYVGLAMDSFGVWNYYMKDPNSPNAVHPAKAGVNTIMGAMGTYGTSLMAIPSTLYFGIDAFYPKGWGGLAIDQESLYRDNRAINPNYQAFPGAMKF